MHTDLQPTDLTTASYKHVPFYVRKSHIESFSFCPRQFYLQYIEERQPFENYAMTSGTRFHNFAELFFQVCDDYDPSQWMSFIPKEFGGYERPAAEYFIEREMFRKKHAKHFQPAFLEIELFSDTHLLGGRLDRVDWIDQEKKTVEILEYKMSSKLNELSLKRQLGFYTILVEEVLGLTVENVKLINPRLKETINFGRPDTDLPLKWADKIREHYENPELCIPKCSTGRYAVCQMCQTTEEAGLFKDIEWDGEY